MELRSTGLNGSFVVEPERSSDVRGFFARTWCSMEFAQIGLPADMVQSSVSYNQRKGTLRGIHFQAPPSREGKLVRCTMGAIWDLIVDLRPASPSFLTHFSIELSQENRLALYVPPGFGHGFQTLRDASEVMYLMSDYYEPSLSRGLRWDDPRLDIRWPEPPTVMIERDRTYEDLDDRIVRELSGFDYPARSADAEG